MERIIHPRIDDAGSPFGDFDRHGKDEMEGTEKETIDRGRRKTTIGKPNTETIVWSLGHLTLTRIIDRGRRKQPIFSKWNLISREIFGNILSDPYGNQAVLA